MQSALLRKTRENIKPSYQSKNGTLFVHGLTLDNGIEYEYHSKSNSLRFQPNTPIWYENTETDRFNNNKIKKPTDKDPNIGQAASIAPQAQVPVPVLPPANTLPIAMPNSSSSTLSKNTYWIQVFAAICNLKSGTGVKLEEIISATDQVVATKLS